MTSAQWRTTLAVGVILLVTSILLVTLTDQTFLRIVGLVVGALAAVSLILVTFDAKPKIGIPANDGERTRGNEAALLTLGLVVLAFDLIVFSTHPDVSGATLVIMVVGLVAALPLIAIAAYRLINERRRKPGS